MSRIGKKPVEIPSGVEVTVAGGEVCVKGAQGELRQEIPEGISIVVEGSTATVERANDDRQTRCYHGLVRSLLANMVEGVNKGYSKSLVIEGVGFRAAIQGQKLSLSLGFASPILFEIPSTVKIAEEGGTKVTVSGADKQQVGDVAARIRSYFPAEPYKGKGIRYDGEQIKRKVGKTVA